MSLPTPNRNSFLFNRVVAPTAHQISTRHEHPRDDLGKKVGRLFHKHVQCHLLDKRRQPSRRNLGAPPPRRRSSAAVDMTYNRQLRRHTRHPPPIRDSTWQADSKVDPPRQLPTRTVDDLKPSLGETPVFRVSGGLAHGACADQGGEDLEGRRRTRLITD